MSGPIVRLRIVAFTAALLALLILSSSAAAEAPHTLRIVGLLRAGGNADPLLLRYSCQIPADAPGQPFAEDNAQFTAYLPHKLRIHGKSRTIVAAYGDNQDGCDEIGHGFNLGFPYQPWESSLQSILAVAKPGGNFGDLNNRDLKRAAAAFRKARVVRLKAVLTDPDDDSHHQWVSWYTVPIRGWTVSCFKTGSDGQPRISLTRSSHTPDPANHPPVLYESALPEASDRCALAIQPWVSLGVFSNDPDGDQISLSYAVDGQVVQTDPFVYPGGNETYGGLKPLEWDFHSSLAPHAIDLTVTDQHGASTTGHLLVQPTSSREPLSKWGY